MLRDDTGGAREMNFAYSGGSGNFHTDLEKGPEVMIIKLNLN